MKRIILLIILVIVNVLIYIEKTKLVNVEKIDIELNKDELGIIFLKLEDSNSLLLKLNNKNILYIIDYKNDKKLNDNINKFGIELDYVLMKEDYDIDIDSKKIINNKIALNNIHFDKNKITYNNKTFCININDACNFIYYTKDYFISNENVVIFYIEELEDKILANTYDKWVDKYEITKDAYTILKLNNNYEVVDFIK